MLNFLDPKKNRRAVRFTPEPNSFGMDVKPRFTVHSELLYRPTSQLYRPTSHGVRRPQFKQNKTQLKNFYYKSVNEIEGNVHMQFNIQQSALTPTIKYFTCGIPSPLNLRISHTEKMIRNGQAYWRLSDS